MNHIRACLYLSVFMIMGLSDAVIPILPDLSNGVALIQSTLFSAYFAGALVTMIPFGMLADRYGNSPFISLALVLTVVSGSLILYFDDPVMLVSARFMEGCACGAFFPAAFSMLTGFKRSRQYIGEFNFLLNLGLAAGVAVAAVLKCYYLKGGILAFTILALPALMLAFSLTRTHEKKTSHAPANMTNIYTVIFDTQYLQIWITSFVLFGGTGVIVAYFPSYTDLTSSAQGLALAGIYLGTMATSLIGGHLNVTERCMIRVGVLITGIGIIATIYHPVGLTIMGAGAGFALIGLVTGVASLDSDRGMTMGAFNTYTYAGFAVLPMFAATILMYADYAMLFWITGIAVMAVLAFPLRALEGR